MSDIIITCIRCEQPFTFTSAEQKEYRNFGFDTPKRCPECRLRKSSIDQLRKISKNTSAKRRKRQKRLYRDC